VSRITAVVQKINILIINQSVVDLGASLFAILSTVVEVDGTGMSSGSAWDQFVCGIWLTSAPLWAFLGMSTYGIILTALERYAAVIYPVWYKVIVKLQSAGQYIGRVPKQRIISLIHLYWILI